MPDKTLRLDLDLYQQVAKVAEKADRTPRKQIERWLREALETCDDCEGFSFEPEEE